MTASRPTGRNRLATNISDVGGPLGEIEPFADHNSLLLLTDLERISNHVATLDSADQVVAELLRQLKVQIRFDETQLAKIPTKGSLCIVCAQPFGTIEALVVHDMVRRRRSDVKVFSNMLLSSFPRMHEAAEFIDPGWRLASRLRNVLSLKSALRFLAEGGAIGPLPIDDTALFDHEPWHVVDPTWRQSVASVLRESGATLLPISFTGKQNALHSLANLLSPSHGSAGTRAADLLTTRIAVEIGRPIRSAELQCLDHPEQVEAFLRDRCELLTLRNEVTKKAKKPRATGFQPVAPAEGGGLIEREVDALPEAQRLVSQRGRLVAYARGNECPALLRELGRLRQIAFRAVGEGTKEPRDLDQFDDRYDHLFVWNEQSAEIIGAYRLGRTDSLEQEEQPYSATLFRYTPTFFSELGPALELGRSFVRPEYQRSPAGLIMLWKGIGEYVHRHPRYRYLLGPVSISADYGPTSQQLMVSYMEEHHFASEWASHVTPRMPFDPDNRRKNLFRRVGRWCDGIAEAGRWVAHLERDDKGLPVLVKSYLQLGGRMLGFNVDADFGNCVDGLVLVDLLKTNRTTLQQFMGPSAAQSFLSHHGQES